MSVSLVPELRMNWTPAPQLLSTHLPQLPGNSQYLTKSSIGEVDQLVNAIQLAVIGRGNSAGKLKNHVLGKFTDSQIETLRLVAQGLSNAEIARRRFVTEIGRAHV